MLSLSKRRGLSLQVRAMFERIFEFGGEIDEFILLSARRLRRALLGVLRLVANDMRRAAVLRRMASSIRRPTKGVFE